MNWTEHLQSSIEDKKARHLLRSLKPIDAPTDAHFIKDGANYINFISNNYLGIANHPALKKESMTWVEKWGTGSGGSRLLGGDKAYHHQLEEELQHWKNLPAVLLFNSGYNANLSLGSICAQLGIEVFADRLNHASLWDGLLLGKTKWHRYHHLDYACLEEKLKQSHGPKAVFTESVFSMDGDLAPLQDLAQICQKHQALLVVDEAHSEGLYGPQGSGLTHALDIDPNLLVVMGTFGKAMGSFGAYIGSSSLFKENLINLARPFVYTTSLPASVCGANFAAIQLVKNMDSARAHLQGLQSYFHSLSSGKYQGGSHILPIIIGENQPTIELAQKLDENHILTQAVRAPTVPPGTARLRINLTANHTQGDMETLWKHLQ